MAKHKCPHCESGVLKEVEYSMEFLEETVTGLLKWQCTYCEGDVVDMGQLDFNRKLLSKVLE